MDPTAVTCSLGNLLEAIVPASQLAPSLTCRSRDPVIMTLSSRCDKETTCYGRRAKSRSHVGHPILQAGALALCKCSALMTLPGYFGIWFFDLAFLGYREPSYPSPLWSLFSSTEVWGLQGC